MKLTVEAIAEIKAIEDRQGRLTPEQVIEAARDESSALHACFEWDNDAAADKWRIEQARELITRVRIEIMYQERTIKVVNYVRDPGKTPADPGYQALMKIRARGAAELLTDELDRITALIERVIGIATARAREMPGVAAELAGIKAQIDSMKQR